jgi:hypothetical protein
MGLRELDLVLEDIVYLSEVEDLIDVDFGPLVDDAFYDVQTFFGSHLPNDLNNYTKL